MKRRHLLTSIVTVLFLLLLYKGMDYVRLPFAKLSAFEAVPNNSPMILSFNNLFETQKLLNKVAFAKDFEGTYLIQKIKNDLAALEALFNQRKEYYSVFTKSRKLAALRVSSSKDLDFVYVIDQYQSPFYINDFLFGLENVKINKSTYRNQDVYSIENKGAKAFTISSYNGLIICARFPLLVEEAINQLNEVSTNISRNKLFQLANKNLTEKQDVSVYLNFDHFSFLLSTFVKVEKRINASRVKTYGSWLKMDLAFEADGIQAKGILVPAIGTKILSPLRKQKMGNHRAVMKIIPDNVALLSWWNITDWSVFLRNNKLFFSHTDNENTKDFNQYFLPWISNDLVCLMTEPYSASLQSEKFLAIKTNDVALAEHYLKKYTEKVGQLKSYEYQTYQIKQILSNDLLKPVFGNMLNPVHNPFYTIIGNLVVFANSSSALEIWIDKYIVGQTLSQDINYLKFNTKLSASANIFLFVNTSNLLQLLNVYTKEKLQVSLKEEFNAYKKVSQIGFELTPKKNHFEINARFKYSPSPKKSSSIAWKTTLASPAATAPTIIKNEETGESSIFIQDQRHFLYLLNQNGVVTWKKPLDGKLKSAVVYIDYFKNGKAYYTFNTANKIYMINQKGKSIPGFPLQLKSPATNAMTLVDFANRKEYAFYVACENGNIYGFDVYGHPLSGWNPKPNIGRVTQAIQHFQKGPRDYIVIQNEAGQLFAFRRNGQKRFEVKTNHKKFLSPLDFQVSVLSSRIVTVDENAKAFITNLEGKSFELAIPSGANESVKFAFLDLIGDSRKDYISLSNKTLSCYSYTDNNFEKAFEYTYPETQDSVFSIQFYEEDKAYIGTFSKEKQKIHLLDANGNLYQDFPMSATTSFKVVDLFNERKNTLVAANGNSIYAYRLR